MQARSERPFAVVTERTLRIAIALLALAGAGVTSYLVYARYTGTQIACSTGGCEAVQRSRYSEFAGLPVAVLGLPLYVSLFFMAFLRGALAVTFEAVVAVGGLLFAAYLLVVQLAVIHAVCQWCVASDVLLGAVAVLAVLRLRVPLPSQGAAESSFSQEARSLRQLDPRA
ncbi:MAG: hypothetical protein C5B48_13020 [Candidatus Rokuibacteriota bacterium]|nr:MAG: hypothetical protein C5B48_13020 [Candidatus Rokubacteria bacterium]